MQYLFVLNNMAVKVRDSLNISQIMRVLACLLIRKDNFSQLVVAPRGPIGRESALAWADRYAGMGHAPRNPCFTYDTPL